jgi:hypothetical protein
LTGATKGTDTGATHHHHHAFVGVLGGIVFLFLILDLKGFALVALGVVVLLEGRGRERGDVCLLRGSDEGRGGE